MAEVILWVYSICSCGHSGRRCSSIRSTMRLVMCWWIRLRLVWHPLTTTTLFSHTLRDRQNTPYLYLYFANFAYRTLLSHAHVMTYYWPSVMLFFSSTTQYWSIDSLVGNFSPVSWLNPQCMAIWISFILLTKKLLDFRVCLVFSLIQNLTNRRLRLCRSRKMRDRLIGRYCCCCCCWICDVMHPVRDLYFINWFRWSTPSCVSYPCLCCHIQTPTRYYWPCHCAHPQQPHQSTNYNQS